MVVIFPGSISEYESFVGYKVQVVDIENNEDTEDSDKGLWISTNRRGNVYEKKELKKLGIEALVNAHCVRITDKETHFEYYGLPVRRKN